MSLAVQAGDGLFLGSTGTVHPAAPDPLNAANSLNLIGVPDGHLELYATAITTDAYGTAVLSLQVFTAGLDSAVILGTDGAVSKVFVAGISSAEAFGNNSLSNKIFAAGLFMGTFGSSLLIDRASVLGIVSSEIFGAPVERTRLLVSGISSGAFGADKLSSLLTVPSISSSTAVGSVKILDLLVTVGISSGNTVTSPVVSRTAHVTGFSSASYGSSKLSETISVLGIAFSGNFGVGEVFEKLVISGISTREIIGLNTLAVTIHGIGKGSGFLEGTEHLSNLCSVNSMVSSENFGTSHMQGVLVLTPSGIRSQENTGIHQLMTWADPVHEKPGLKVIWPPQAYPSIVTVYLPPSITAEQIKNFFKIKS